MKKNFKTLGKLLSQLFMMSAVFSSCINDDTATVQRGETAPLQITVNTDKPGSRVIITDEYLASGAVIGVGLFTPDGDNYDGQEYANIQFTAAGEGTSQVWSAGNNTPTVSANEAHLLAYWPYNGDMESAALMPVETATQTDYMYSGLVSGITNAKPQADITLYHALTDIRVKLVLGNYTGDVAVSSVAVSSPALGTAADCSVADGTLSDITGQGDAVALDVDFDMVAGGTDTDIMLVPDASVTSGTTIVAVTVGGKKYNAEIDFGTGYLQGYVYTYTLTLTNEGFEVTKVTVYPWQEGDNDAATLKPEGPKVSTFKLRYNDAFVQYQFEEGMTWREWLDSDYNTDGWALKIKENQPYYFIVEPGEEGWNFLDAADENGDRNFDYIADVENCDAVIVGNLYYYPTSIE